MVFTHIVVLFSVYKDTASLLNYLHEFYNAVVGWPADLENLKKTENLTMVKSDKFRLQAENFGMVL